MTNLIQGESGFGKEIVARAVHETSRRRARAFVKVAFSMGPHGAHPF